MIAGAVPGPPGIDQSCQKKQWRGGRAMNSATRHRIMEVAVPHGLRSSNNLPTPAQADAVLRTFVVRHTPGTRHPPAPQFFGEPQRAQVPAPPAHQLAEPSWQIQVPLNHHASLSPPLRFSKRVIQPCRMTASTDNRDGSSPTCAVFWQDAGGEQAKGTGQGGRRNYRLVFSELRPK